MGNANNSDNFTYQPIEFFQFSGSAARRKWNFFVWIAEIHYWSPKYF